MTSVILHQPDDWHVHFRDDALLNDTVNATAKHFKRALVMPNLKPALTSVVQLLAYRQRILNALTVNPEFMPYMTLYLNQHVTATDLEAAHQNSFILGAKLYPLGATTHSDEGVETIQTIYPLLEIMQDNDLVLQIHGETTHDDIFDRETQFIERVFKPLIQNFPRLRIVFEHITTRAAVDFILDAPGNIAATITPHHLLYNRNDLLAGGIKPHNYCLPILKRESDQMALKQAATSGHPKFFAGTDSAPHDQTQKESACGCAGIYSAPHAIAFYAETFEAMNRLDKLDDFLSRWGSEFYQLPQNQETILLERKPQTIPHQLPLGSSTVIPMAAGQTIAWSIHEPA